MTPKTKKLISSIAVAILGMLLVLAQSKLAPYLSEAGIGVLVSAYAGATHWLNAWGAVERAEQVVAAKKAAES